MGRTYLISILLVSTLLLFIVQPGFGRNLPASPSYSLMQEEPRTPTKVRDLSVELKDYQPPRAPTKARHLTVELMDYGSDAGSHANDAHASIIPKGGSPYNNVPAPSPHNHDD